MRTLVVALILALTTAATGQVPPAAQHVAEVLASEGLVSIDQMQHPGLLVKTSQPGLFEEAPVVTTKIALTIRGVIARGVVQQRFENSSSRCVEAIYVFPLSDGAAIDTLRMRVGGRTIEGEIHERADAAEVYEQAKSDGKHASLLEQHRPNLFTVSVASIAPGESTEIEIQYQEVVRYDGRYTLRVPLSIGPRYSPRVNPSAVPAETTLPPIRFAATRTSGALRNPVELSVDLDGGVPLDTVVSPTHELITTPLSASHVQLRPRDVQVASDRDFELIWKPRLGALPQRASFSEVLGDQRYTLVMLFPPDVATTPTAVLPRESVFIIDTSGSMAGPSMEQAKQALLTAIGRLRPSDRFNVIEFNSVSRRLFDDSRFADKAAVSEALEWVRALESTGGTEMLGAMQLALDGAPKRGEVRQVIFITDGQVSNEREVFEYIRAHIGDARLFTVGIGTAPNSYFMSNAARAGRGTFTTLGNIAELEEQMTLLFAKLESPVLSNLALQTSPDAEVWPDRLPDLYAGEPLVITMRTPVAAQQSLTHVVSSSWNTSLGAENDVQQSGIARLWARQKIDALRDRIFTGGTAPEIKAEIVKLALEHHLVTEHTSLVAVDNTPTGIDAQSCRPELVPLNLPAGWGGVDGGVLPQTGTNAMGWLIVGLALLVLAAIVRREL